MTDHESDNVEAATTLMILRLCDRLHASPAEIVDMEMQFVADVTTILGQESDLAREKK